MRRQFITIALAGTASLAWSAPVTAAPAPQITVHSIFSGSRQNTFHVGAVAMVLTKGPAPKVARVCVEPAPIDRPACARSRLFAPASAGSTKVDVTFVDGSAASASIDVRAAATRIGGATAVPGHAACDKVTLYGNYDPRARRFHDRVTTVKRDTNLALYNRIGKDALFMWNYKTGKSGFGKGHLRQARPRRRLIRYVLTPSLSTRPPPRVNAHTTMPDNTVVPALARRLAFRYEGVLRRRNLERGRRVDIVCFGVLRDEWSARGGACRHTLR